MLDRTPDFDPALMPARPGDVESPNSTVRALYNAISGPEGVERDWDRVRSLFDPRVRFLIGRWLADPNNPRDVVFEWDLESFIAEGREEWLRNGFWETELSERTEVYGNVAHVMSSYVSCVESPDAEAVGRGINSFQLLRHNARWRIVSVAWDIETPETPIPDDFLAG